MLRVDIIYIFAFHYHTEEIVSLMTLSAELRPLLQKVMVVYTVYMKGVKQGEMFEQQLHFFLHYISEEIVSLMTL